MLLYMESTLSENLLLVHRNANFYMLVLYPINLLNWLISPTSFLFEFFRIYIKLCHLQTEKILLLPFQLWYLFFYFSCLVALASTSSTMLNRSGRSGHPCLISNLREKASNLLLLSMTLAVGLSYTAIIMLRYFLSMPNLLRTFIVNGYWIFSNAFSASF